MTIRYITSFNGKQPGDTASLSTGVEEALIAGGLARAGTEDDNSGRTDLQAQVTSLSTALSTANVSLSTATAKLASVATNYADDAAAAAGNVAVGSLYSTSGAVKVRAA